MADRYNPCTYRNVGAAYRRFERGADTWTSWASTSTHERIKRGIRKVGDWVHRLALRRRAAPLHRN
jgi:hypothetical protein